ncbi:MAG: MarR family winged helix-turn-helix transcriptional regulator [Candidatus Thorarchaeota archaeon]
MNSRSQGGFLITKIHHLGARVFSKMLKDYDIEVGPGQGRVIFALWQRDGVPIKELAKRTSLGKSTLTDLLDRLEESGHIERAHSKSDRREILIALTQRARDLNAKYNQVSDEMTDIFYSGFTKTEIEQFEKFLELVLDNLTKAETDHP